MEILSLKFEMRQLIPVSVIEDLHNLCVTNNWAMEDAVTYHRNTLIPNGYAPNSIKPNIPESYLDKLHSPVATYRYGHRIQQFKEEGHVFSSYMYVPEVIQLVGQSSMNGRTTAIFSREFGNAQEKVGLTSWM